VVRKKKKDLYDEKGRWKEERSRIKGAIRRTFRLSPQMKEILEEARVELPPALKKDGTPGKKPQVRYRCAECKELFSKQTKRSSNVNVDHIEPVVPLWKTETNMTYDEIVRGVFCEKDNLQVLCSIPLKRNNNEPSCHKVKTDKENWMRKYYKANHPEDKTKKTYKAIEKEYKEHLKTKKKRKKK